MLYNDTVDLDLRLKKNNKICIFLKPCIDLPIANKNSTVVFNSLDFLSNKVYELESMILSSKIKGNNARFYRDSIFIFIDSVAVYNGIHYKVNCTNLIKSYQMLLKYVFDYIGHVPCKIFSITTSSGKDIVIEYTDKQGSYRRMWVRRIEVDKNTDMNVRLKQVSDKLGVMLNQPELLSDFVHRMTKPCLK